MSNGPREKEIRIRIRDSEDEMGVYFAIDGEMRIVDMLGISRMCLAACVEAGEARLAGAMQAVQGALEAVQRTISDEYPGATMVSVKN